MRTSYIPNHKNRATLTKNKNKTIQKHEKRPQTYIWSETKTMKKIKKE